MWRRQRALTVDWHPLDADPPAQSPDLIEPARSTAIDKLDEGRQALVLATGWLRSKRSAEAATRGGEAPLQTIS
jgi:hypothetical protein